MEEDIKICKELIENKHGELLNCWDYGEEARKSLNNILNELERLQKEFELLDHECSRLEQKEIELENKKCLHCGNDTPLYCENCYQELISKNTELQMRYEKINKFLHSNSFVFQNENGDIQGMLLTPENFIPKQVVRNKIEELEKEIIKLENKKLWNEPFDTIKKNRFVNYFNILKELLGE